MFRDSLIDTAVKLRIDEPLLRVRATLSPRHRGDAREHRELRRALAGVIGPASNCIDIGAFRGRVLSEIVRLAPRGRHIAYEPLPDRHSLLVRRFPGVEVRQAAVSKEPGEATFTIVNDSPGLSGFVDRWHDHDVHRTVTMLVRVEALDHDLPEGYVPHFIKVDVEGAERLVFEGAVRTIAEHRPAILFEHGPGGAEHYETRPGDIYELLAGECGLRIFALSGGGPLTLAEFEDTFHRNEEWNFLARA
jgi:FkbM family methyltransferase